MADHQQYKAPPGTPSSIGVQIRTDFYQKKALTEAAKTSFFGQMADVTNMPKHYGKTIKLFHYLPLLDDANINDQGIDADGQVAGGATMTYKATIAVDHIDLQSTGNGYVTRYFVAESAAGGTAGDATTAAEAKVLAWANSEAPVDGGGGLGLAAANYAEVSTTGGSSAYDLGYRFATSVSVPNTGNLYGSSKDVGTINGKLPALSENGGRVNRVGFKRISLEGTLEKFGFFDEYTQESLDFDTDSELEMHVNREMVLGANEITEDALQIDLLQSAGVVRFGGIATATDQITGEGADISIMSYKDLMRLSIDLDDNRTPKSTKIISGSRMIDTKVIDAARYLYIGSELIPQVRAMKDANFNQAFIPVQQYAAAGNVAVGEIGSVDQFRIIVVPEMMHWAAAGADVTDNEGYRSSDDAGTEKYDVFPMLCIGSGSFTTVGFQTDGKTVKFTITHKKPGRETADRFDPYGETGFMSIKWYYGFMLLRPERIALCKTVAEW